MFCNGTWCLQCGDTFLYETIVTTSLFYFLLLQGCWLAHSQKERKFSKWIPIHRIIFFAVGVIGRMPVINLLDGLSWGGFIPFFIRDFYPLEAFVGRQFFLAGHSSFQSSLFLSFWLHHLIVASGSFCVWVLFSPCICQEDIMSTFTWLLHIQVWGGVGIST